MPMELDESISLTRVALQTALQNVTSDSSNSRGIIIPSIFTEEHILRRPPFSYIHALVKFIVQQQTSCLLSCSKELLFPVTTTDINNTTTTSANENQEHLQQQQQQQQLSRKEQLTFITRLLVLVSQVSGRRFDILISPSNILCGRNELSTHEFLRSLATIIIISPASTVGKDGDGTISNNNDDTITMSKAVQYVIDMGDTTLYTRGVQARRAFTRLQAICRGWLVRGKLNHNEATINNGRIVLNDMQTQTKSSALKTSKQMADNQALLESYDAMLSRKAEVEEEILVIEKRLNRENDKLIRMLNLKVMHKSANDNSSSTNSMPQPPKSACHYNSTVGKSQPHNNVDQAFANTITKFSERQRTIKQKERQIYEKESRLKQRFARAKHKEIELKVQEERISALADKMRNQQLHLKEQKLQFERSKLLNDQAINLQPETSRPCVLCTEKKIQLRELRTKIRQRTRVLKQREAAVIENVHELRRREMQLVKREQMIADTEEQQPFDMMEQKQPTQAIAEESSSSSEPEHDRHVVAEESNEPQGPVDEPESDESPSLAEAKKSASSLPSVAVRRDALSNPPRKKNPRKRRRQNPRGCRSGLPSNQMNDVDRKNSIRSSLCTSTIVEETASIDVQTTSSVSFDEEDDSVEADSGECLSVEENHDAVSSSYQIIDIHKARKSLGIVKPKIPLMNSNVANKQQSEEPTATISSPSSAAQSTVLSKRHVFSFEMKKTTQPSQFIVGKDRSRKPSSRDDRDRRRPKQKKHDDPDWISSFDGQMECALKRLSEL